MAMEDAVCLSHELGRESLDIDQAFESYRRNRVNRTARIQIQSRLMGDHVFHPAGGHADLRNAILRSMSVEDIYDNLQWLYGIESAEAMNAVR